MKTKYEMKIEIKVTIQSQEKDADLYEHDLIEYFSNHNFKVINSKWKKDTTSTSRTWKYKSDHLGFDIIIEELYLERICYNIEYPSIVYENVKNEIYELFNSFLLPRDINDNEFNYIHWISVIPAYITTIGYIDTKDDKNNMKKEVNVEKLIKIFEDMACRNTLLTGNNVSQEDLLTQIIGVITHAAMHDDIK